MTPEIYNLPKFGPLGVKTQNINDLFYFFYIKVWRGLNVIYNIIKSAEKLIMGLLD